jgi:hypothetical protein
MLTISDENHWAHIWRQLAFRDRESLSRAARTVLQCSPVLLCYSNINRALVVYHREFLAIQKKQRTTKTRTRLGSISSSATVAYLSAVGFCQICTPGELMISYLLHVLMKSTRISFTTNLCLEIILIKKPSMSKAQRYSREESFHWYEIALKEGIQEWEATSALFRTVTLARWLQVDTL